jgi:hypothetical protein
LEQGEEGIVFFVAGYISRSLLKAVKCSGCIVLLRKSDEAPVMEFEEDASDEGKEARESYMNMINRGGLVTPSDLVNVTCVHALQLKALIFDHGSMQKLLLKSGNPRKVFVQCYVEMLQKASATKAVLDQKCSNGHEFEDFVPKIATTIFNIFSNNYVAELNDDIACMHHENVQAKKAALVGR